MVIHGGYSQPKDPSTGALLQIRRFGTVRFAAANKYPCPALRSRSYGIFREVPNRMNAKIERVARAIESVQLFSRFNDWTPEAVKGFPIEVCRYVNGAGAEIEIVERFPASVGEIEAVRLAMRRERAKAAIAIIAADV